MKIGLVCPYNIFKGGGVQECVYMLQKEFIARGHEVVIITPEPRTHEGQKVDNILFVGTSADVRSPFHTTAQVSATVDVDEIEAVLQQDFDILNFHEPWVPMMGRQLLSQSNSINIATFHAKLPGTMMSRTIERVVTPYARSVMKYLDELTAVSSVAAEYVHSLTDQPITIIPNGIDLKKYQAKNHKVRAAGAPQTILYVGRLEKRKGVKYLLEAFKQLTEHKPDVRLIIAGDGPDLAKLELVVEDYEIPNVQFAGYISDADKLRLLGEADLFCSPALYGESFGIVLLEAMAMGTVTVAGNNPGYASVMTGKGALSLVNPKDIREFSRRMLLMLDDPEICNLWKAWAADHINDYDGSRVAEKYLETYERALTVNPSKRL